MSKIKFAIIGCGRIAQRHAEHINNYGELVAVCDIVSGKATALAEKYHAKQYSTAEELLSNEKTVDCSHWATGVYIFVINNKSINSTFKIIKD